MISTADSTYTPEWFGIEGAAEVIKQIQEKIRKGESDNVDNYNKYRRGGSMKRFFLEYNERQIVHAAVRIDSRHGKPSPFSKRAETAIRKAKDDMDVGEVSPDVRNVIVEKIYQSIAYKKPWEHLGETYCYRGQFYQYRKQFCFLVADNMGLIDTRRQQSEGR